MKQNYFEREEIHPYVAALLSRDGWIYHHEYAFGDGSRADFVAIQIGTGRLAVIECKRMVNSTNDLINQVNRYHTQLGYRDALKWVFVLQTPHSGTIKRLNAHQIVAFPLENEPSIEYGPIDRSSRVRFAKALEQFKPLWDERDELAKKQRDLINRITQIRV